jgi:hypothetical protein
MTLATVKNETTECVVTVKKETYFPPKLNFFFQMKYVLECKGSSVGWREKDKPEGVRERDAKAV